MKKYLNSVIPFVAVIPKLFGTATKDEFRKKLLDRGSKKLTLPTTLDLAEEEQIRELKLHGVKTIDNLVPGAIEIPMDMILESGFSIKFYLKDDTVDCPDDKKESGIIMASIQHNDTKRSFLQDSFSTKFHKVTEIEVATLNSVIVADEIPDAFGKNYEMDKLYKASNFKLLEFKLEDEINKRVREEKIRLYQANPEMAEKHTKKALEKLKFKLAQSAKGIAPKDTTFTDEVLRVLGEVAGIHNLDSFDQLKDIPMFKNEIDKGGSFAELLERFSNLAESLPKIK